MSIDLAALVERHLGEASDAHYTVLMCPEPARRGVAAALALYAALREMLSVQPDVLPTKVTWWHEELARLRAGTPVHPLSQTLLDAAGPRAGDALHDALDALLHGAVMDANSVEVTPESLDDYLRLRCGALHALFDILLDTRSDDETRVLAARVHGTAQLVAESRDPRYANRPNATLQLLDEANDQALLDDLTARHTISAAQLAGGRTLNVASAVLIALVRANWPVVLASPPGQVVPPAKPWRTLLTAWRAARRARRPDS